METKRIEEIKKIVEKLCSLVGISGQSKVSYDSENESVRIEITSDKDAGVLIGRKGENLNALQSVIGMIVKSKTEEWIRITLDVNGWRLKEEESLIALATDAANRAKETGEVQRLYNLTPAQRRVVHMKLSEIDGVTTESVGEGDERFLEVRPN